MQKTMRKMESSMRVVLAAFSWHRAIFFSPQAAAAQRPSVPETTYRQSSSAIVGDAAPLAQGPSATRVLSSHWNAPAGADGPGAEVGSQDRQ